MENLIWQIPTALVTFVVGFSFIQNLLLGGMKKDIRQLEEIERFPVIDASGSKLVRKAFSSITGETTAWYEPAPSTPEPVPDSGIGNPHYPPRIGPRGTAGDSGAYKERTVKDVYDEMTDEQKSVLHHIVEESLDKENPSELDLVKFTFETFTFEQKRVACWLFSDSMDDEKLDLWFDGAYKVYDDMSDQKQRWVGTQKFRIREYLHNGKIEYQGIAYYLAEQVGIMCQVVEKTNFDESAYQDNLRYLTKPQYGSMEII